MIEKLMRLFGRESREDQAVAIVASALPLAPVQAMQSISDWLAQEAPRFAARKDGLQILRRIDPDLRTVAESAINGMVDAHANHARSTLLLQTTVPYCDTILRTYTEALKREVEMLAKKPQYIGLVQASVSSWLYWIGREHVVRFVREPRMDRLPWHEIRPLVEFALGLGGTLAARLARPEGESGRLQKQLAHLVLLSRTLSPDLQGRQLLIADRIADTLASFIHVSQQHSDSTPFGQVSDDDNPPTMLTQVPTKLQGRGLYYGLEKTLLELIALENLISTQHKLPQKLDPAGELQVAETLTVIKHLKNRWSGREAKRLAERRAISGTLSVAYEFAALRRLVSAALAPPKTQTVERCEVEDVSATGLGLKLSRHKGWAKIGLVVGIKTDKDNNWRIGVLRRVLVRGQGEVFAGVQMWSRDPESVRLTVKAKVSQWEMVSQVQSYDNLLALYLRPDNGTAQQHLLLTAKPELQVGQLYAAPATRDGDLSFRVLSQQEICVDCVVYRCELLTLAPPPVDTVASDRGEVQ
ncbi:hypothetical protein [Chitinimonas lacunae]|uniref:PilZ domain-containing protein n=1 Tax=Chitinimonas lacunae TaxID=1963018 RepID=A0ABV8MLK5_9NEIS